ncbi:MAG: ATP-binding cassette domain-containing protein [Trueperaceae bacterium]
MELITARNITIERNGGTLLQDAQLTVRAGSRLGLVGANGSGKSTLLQVLAGVWPLANGRLRHAPGSRVGYLPQEQPWEEGQNAWKAALLGLARTTELERELRAEEVLLSRGDGRLDRYANLQEMFERTGGYAAEAGLRESLAALGLPNDKLELTVEGLSGGERARLALARVLSSEPDVLLLDEPTNHLDLPALSWLGERLHKWRGAVVLVSHDRALLDEICTETAELRGRSLSLTRGGITLLREQQGVLRRASERQLHERRKAAERIERVASELRSWGTAKAQRRRRRFERELEDLGRESGGVAQDGITGVTLGFDAAGRLLLDAREASGILLDARHLRSVHGRRIVLGGAHVRLQAGEKVALLGPNGSGKSTLLRLLAGLIPSDDPKAEFWWHRDAKLYYADQVGRGLADDAPVFDQLTELASVQRAHLLLALSGLEESKRHVLPASLSGGERARAGLARLLAAQANLLLLDEPTNDLDMNAIETLHHAIEASSAAMVIATHDRALARLATRVWVIEEGQLVEYRGGLEGYLAGRRRLEPKLLEPGELNQGQLEQGQMEQEQMEQERLAQGQLEQGQMEQERLAREGVELEHLELERLGVETRLDDPLLLAERERQRLERRHKELIDELSLRYDRALPAPRATYSVREAGIAVAANLSAEGLCFESEAAVELRLLVREGIGHLVMREEQGRSLLPWARSALLDAAVRLAFYALAPSAVQHHSPVPPDTRLLERGEDDWWWLSRERFEQLEGWRRPGPAPPAGNRRRAKGRGRRPSKRRPSKRRPSKQSATIRSRSG